jgi:hypothetical protein
MILAVGCEYEPVDGWESIMPAIKAPSNYKKPEAIAGYLDKRLAELRGGKAAVDPVVGSISRAVVVSEKGKVIHDGSGADALITISEKLKEEQDYKFVFGIKLHRMIKLMAVELALRDGELPSGAQWAVDLDQRFGYNWHYIDPISVLFGSSDMDVMAVARRTDYVFKSGKGADTAVGMAKFALALGGLLGLGG